MSLVIWAFVPQVFSQASLFDASFAIGAGANGKVHSVVVQNDGRILVGGSFTEIAGHPQAYLARLESDGELDTSFGRGTDGTVYRLVQQPDGKLLVGGGFSNLQGVVRQSIGRLLTNGAVDEAFDAGTNFINSESVLTLAVQPDGKILVASFFDGSAPITELKRFDEFGQRDGSFVQTNVFNYYVTALLARTNGVILVGGGFFTVNGLPCAGLALLDVGGQLQTGGTPMLLEYSDIFSFTELTNGDILAGGLLHVPFETNRLVLAKLTPELHWNTNFHTDLFDPAVFSSSFGYVSSVLSQPDGKIVLGGSFQEVGGYWRRGVVRLDSEGHVDPCFDPGLGLGGFTGAFTLARQPDGKILAGGDFLGDLAYTNIARLLPQSDCNALRVYLRKEDDRRYLVAATCPPGGTNHFQASSNLVDWVTTDSKTGPYFYFHYDFAARPSVFFRVKKEY